MHWGLISVGGLILIFSLLPPVLYTCGLISVAGLITVKVRYLNVHNVAFQEAFTLTALDKRVFAPPIESKWQRVVNMANTCETFKVNPTTVAYLISKGFRSLTLLSMGDESQVSLPTNW